MVSPRMKTAPARRASHLLNTRSGLTETARRNGSKVRFPRLLVRLTYLDQATLLHGLLLRSASLENTQVIRSMVPGLAGALR